MSENRTVFEAILAAEREGRAAALATIIHAQGSVPRQAGAKMLVWPDGSIVGTVGGGEMESLVIQQALAALDDGQARIVDYALSNPASGDPGVCGGTVQVVIEPLLAPYAVLVIGAGHVGKAVAELAKWLGFRVLVADDRPGYATPEAIPGMDGYYQATPGELARQAPITARTCVVAVTRGIVVDHDLLPALLATPAPYIGLIGSRRRWALTAETLAQQGISAEALARVHAPIGLEVGAETPKEIAVSIMAEVIMVLRGGTGDSMQWMGPSSPPISPLLSRET